MILAYILIHRQQADIELLQFFSVGRLCRKFKGKLFLPRFLLPCILLDFTSLVNSPHRTHAKTFWNTEPGLSFPLLSKKHKLP